MYTRSSKSSLELELAEATTRAAAAEGAVRERHLQQAAEAARLASAAKAEIGQVDFVLGCAAAFLSSVSFGLVFNLGCLGLSQAAAQAVDAARRAALAEARCSELEGELARLRTELAQHLVAVQQTADAHDAAAARSAGGSAGSGWRGRVRKKSGQKGVKSRSVWRFLDVIYTSQYPPLAAFHDLIPSRLDSWAAERQALQREAEELRNEGARLRGMLAERNAQVLPSRPSQAWRRGRHGKGRLLFVPPSCRGYSPRKQ